MVLKRPYILVGWLWFLAGLVPFLGIIQAGIWPELADRYAYLTFIGIFIVISWGASELLEDSDTAALSSLRQVRQQFSF